MEERQEGKEGGWRPSKIGRNVLAVSVLRLGS